MQIWTCKRLDADESLRQHQLLAVLLVFVIYMLIYGQLISLRFTSGLVQHPWHPRRASRSSKFRATSIRWSPWSFVGRSPRPPGSPPPPPRFDDVGDGMVGPSKPALAWAIKNLGSRKAPPPPPPEVPPPRPSSDVPPLTFELTFYGRGFPVEPVEPVWSDFAEWYSQLKHESCTLVDWLL